MCKKHWNKLLGRPDIQCHQAGCVKRSSRAKANFRTIPPDLVSYVPKATKWDMICSACLQTLRRNRKALPTNAGPTPKDSSTKQPQQVGNLLSQRDKASLFDTLMEPAHPDDSDERQATRKNLVVSIAHQLPGISKGVITSENGKSIVLLDEIRKSTSECGSRTRRRRAGILLP